MSSNVDVARPKDKMDKKHPPDAGKDRDYCD
jgi:hypothetical protein